MMSKNNSEGNRVMLTISRELLIDKGNSENGILETQTMLVTKKFLRYKDRNLEVNFLSHLYKVRWRPQLLSLFVSIIEGTQNFVASQSFGTMNVGFWQESCSGFILHLAWCACGLIHRRYFVLLYRLYWFWQ